MKTRLFIVIGSVLVGALVMFGAWKYLDAERDRLVQDASYVTVLVATKSIPAGMTAEEAQDQDLLGTRRVPGKYLAANVVRTTGEIAGKVAADPIAAGEQITTTRFQNPSALGLSIAVPQGYLAVSLPYDTARGVSELVRVGDTVAVIGTFDSPNAGMEPVTSIVVPRADVLAIGRSVNDVEASTQVEEEVAAADSLTITLALTAADAERVVFSQETGRVWFALYPTGDIEPAVSGRATLQSVVR